MKIAGMVTLYNPEKEVANNISSYLKNLDVLYVIDNSSHENKDKLQKSKKIKYLPNFDNLGVATALNIAAKQAIEAGYEWMLTMDQDSKFEKENLKQMIDYIKQNDCKNIGLVSPWHIINTGVKKPRKKIDYPLEVMTSGNIINLKAYQEVNGFKDEYFIDDIDIEYCMNLNIHNYKVARLNYVELKHDLGDIEIKHFLGRNFVCSNHNAIRRYYMVRNTFYLCDLYKNHFPEYCSFLKRGLRGQLQNIILFEKDKFKKVRNMYRGYLDYKHNITGKYPYNN